MRTDWPAPVDAINRYRAAAPIWPSRSDMQWWLSRESPGSELLATRDIEAYAEWFLSPRPPGYPEPHNGRNDLVGLALRGGRGSVAFPADSPWAIPHTTDLAQVIRRLWTPVADHAPAFLDRLAESIFAIAMVRRGGGRYYLVYLTVAWVSTDVPDVATAPIEELMDARKLTVGEIWAMAPLRDTAMVLGEAMPGPLDALARIHHSVTFSPEVFIDLEKIESYEDEGREYRPGERYAVFARNVDTWYVVDLGTRETWGEATVVPHDPNDGLIFNHRETASAFLAERLLEMLEPNTLG